MALAWQSPVYVERKKLLERLPEEPGFAIHLEAPAGFGKSVLAGQLSARLGLRTLWVSALLGEPRALLTKALGLPQEVPWGAVVEALQAEPTLVILEDLTGTEDLSPLLRTLPCLLVLASRKPLPYPELPKLLSEGRLVQLKAADLAFTLEEARLLFAGKEGHGEALLLLVEGCLARGQKARARRPLEGYRTRLHKDLGEGPSPRVETLLKALQG